VTAGYDSQVEGCVERRQKAESGSAAHRDIDNRKSQLKHSVIGTAEPALDPVSAKKYFEWPAATSGFLVQKFIDKMPIMYLDSLVTVSPSSQQRRTDVFISARLKTGRCRVCERDVVMRSSILTSNATPLTAKSPPPFVVIKKRN
jgi:hypothetical protein